MTPTQRLVSALARLHKVDKETIVRAAVVDFAYGRSKQQRADAIQVAQSSDAPHGDEKRHSGQNEVTKNVTATNPR